MRPYTDFFRNSFTFHGRDIGVWLGGPFLWLFFLLVPVVVFLSQLFMLLVFSFLISLFMHLVSAMRFSFSEVWNLGLYALTPLLAATYIGYVVGYVSEIPSVVYLIYFTLAFLAYRNAARANET
jgi:hypothetical protein